MTRQMHQKETKQIQIKLRMECRTGVAKQAEQHMLVWCGASKVGSGQHKLKLPSLPTGGVLPPPAPPAIPQGGRVAGVASGGSTPPAVSQGEGGGRGEAALTNFGNDFKNVLPYVRVR